MIPRSFIITPDAESDLSQAYHWYEQQRAGLGRRFLNRVEDEFQRIAKAPESFAVAYKGVRQTLVRRFPYVICYTSNSNRISVLAVFHGHRDPTEWKSRAT